MSGGCETIVAHCMDYRLQTYLNRWLEVNLPVKSYDLCSIAGGVYDVYDVIRQVDIANRLHHIETINLLFPHLKVELYYLNLNGTFEYID
jgi:hypothetical protein